MAALALAVGALLVTGGSVAEPAGAAGNPIQTENALAGTTSWGPPQQGLTAQNQHALEGYASEISVQPGDTIHLHVSTSPAARYRIQLYRLGWYGGSGGRLLGCIPSCSGDEQGTAYSIPSLDGNGYVDAGWPITDTFTIPSNAVSGYYLAKLVLTNGSLSGSTHNIPLIVSEPSGQRAPALVVAPVNTWQAYNPWGGKSLYDFQSTGGVAAVKVSFNRPFHPGHTPLEYDLDLLRWLEQEGYDIAYATDVDVHLDPSLLLGRKVVLTAGHDEYWTKEMRDAFEAARDSGVNIAFMGANTAYWQARIEDSGHTLVEYRNAANDPVTDTALDTVQFRDLVPSRPECRMMGVAYNGGSLTGIDNFDLPVNASALSHPWFAGTGFTASSVVRQAVGYEWDQIISGCTQPGALTNFFHYSGASPADTVAYTAPSGAIVFSTGTLGFVTALDNYTSGIIDPRLQQFMRNVLADMLDTSSSPTPPGSLSPPVVSGSAVQGQSLSATTGSWTNTPTSYGYQWRRCNTAGTSCADIGSATTSTYLLQAADVGSTLRARVTATNAAGPGTPAESAPTAVVVAVPPGVPVNTGPTGRVRHPGPGPSADGDQRHVDEHTDLLRLPVAALQPERGCVRRHRLGDRLDVSAAGRRRRLHHPRPRYRLQRSRAQHARRLGPNRPHRRRRHGRLVRGNGSRFLLGGAGIGLQVRLRLPTGHSRDRDHVRVLRPRRQPSPIVHTRHLHLERHNTRHPRRDRTNRHRGRKPTRRLGQLDAPLDSAHSRQLLPRPRLRHSRQPSLHLLHHRHRKRRRLQHKPRRRPHPDLRQPRHRTTQMELPDPTRRRHSPSRTHKHHPTGHLGNHHPRPDTDRHKRHLVRQPDLLRLPMAPLQHHRHLLHRHQLRDHLDLPLQAADVGSTLRARVTATNATGPSTPADSTQTTLITAAPPSVPANTALPAVSGTAQVGQTLSASTGSWSNSPTSYGYQWRRCDTAGAACTDIASATAATYLVQAADIGSTLRVQVIASNAGGPSAPATSAQTTAVTAAPPSVPANTAPPAVTGSTFEGQTLSGSTGSWSNSPTSYTRQWARCDSGGANCTDIAGATAATYLLVAADQGSTIRVRVTATNAAGPGAPATSSQTAVVTAVPPPVPVNTALPLVSGTATAGQTLTASTGTWSNGPTSYAYQWRRCNSSGAACVNIGSATASTYLLQAADIGATLRVQVTASNAGGPGAPATSAQTTAVVAAGSFGATAAGSLSGAPGSGYKFGSAYQLATAATATSFEFYARGGTAAQTFTPAIYASNGTGPTTLIVKGATVTVAANQAAGWVSSALPSTALAAGTYYLVLISGTADNQASIYYNAGAATDGVYNTNTPGTPTPTFGTPSTEPRKWSYRVRTG